LQQLGLFRKALKVGNVVTHVWADHQVAGTCTLPLALLHASWTSQGAHSQRQHCRRSAAATRLRDSHPVLFAHCCCCHRLGRIMKRWRKPSRGTRPRCCTRPRHTWR
jgi:hypothetical protein